jgi:diguanylate cyclase (GGDEF)-like protein
MSSGGLSKPGKRLAGRGAPALDAGERLKPRARDVDSCLQDIVIRATKPGNERKRQAALESFGVLDSEPERPYDDLVLLASQICGTSQAAMGLVDGDRVWNKSRIGVPVSEAPRDLSFCGHTVLQTEPLVIEDLALDERFADNPLVAGGPRVRFYAGAPLLTEHGYAVGTLCALDVVPRTLDAEQREALTALARQMVAQLELRRLLNTSRAEALTDPLTGLGNRRRLMADFPTAFAVATEDSPVHLLLCDLNGFKSYNDTFGHNAGDQLLVRLSNALRAALAPEDGVYRLGGDEFCALVDGDGAKLEQARSVARQALTEHGLGFSITASLGSASLPFEAATATNALHLADTRMYQEKGGGSPAASRQTQDVLMSILAESDPILRSHGSAVAELATAVGRRLGMRRDELRRLTSAAELHDIGKVAVPDAILNKPGPLTEDEWAFIKTHTLLGERILAAAPALSQEAALVRSSHERWDGGGYPDGLRGQAIPLESRIIFAADAFNTMTSTRPYMEAASTAEALAELHRCANGQFDPEVVDAVDVVVRASAAPA